MKVESVQAGVFKSDFGNFFSLPNYNWDMQMIDSCRSKHFH